MAMPAGELNHSRHVVSALGERNRGWLLINGQIPRLPRFVYITGECHSDW